MTGRFAVALSLAALLLVAQTAAAYHEEVSLEKASLSDVRSALFGGVTKPGLMNAGKPFKASFRDVVLTNQDAPHLRQIVEDAANLPPDSDVMIRGSIDGKPFVVQMQSSEKGLKEAKIDGLVFTNRHEALSFLEILKDRGMREAKLRGSVEGQLVRGRIDDGKPRFEG